MDKLYRKSVFEKIEALIEAYNRTKEVRKEEGKEDGKEDQKDNKKDNRNDDKKDNKKGDKQTPAYLLKRYKQKFGLGTRMLFTGLYHIVKRYYTQDLDPGFEWDENLPPDDPRNPEGPYSKDMYPKDEILHTVFEEDPDYGDTKEVEEARRELASETEELHNLMLLVKTRYKEYLELQQNEVEKAVATKNYDIMNITVDNNGVVKTLNAKEHVASLIDQAEKEY